MAEYENSPERVGELASLQKPPILVRLDQNGFWHFLLMLTFIKVLIEAVQIRLVQRKLANIQARIATDPLDTSANVTDILRRLDQLKLKHRHLLGDKLSPKLFLDVKMQIVSKSYASIQAAEKLTDTLTTSSHRTILDKIQSRQTQAIHLVQLPKMVYWCSAAATMPTADYGAAQISVKKAKFNLSASGLINLLKNPGHLVNEDTDVVCEVSFKQAQGNSQPASFWQNKLPTLNTSLEHIDEIFFESHHHYNQFKELLQTSEEANLLKLIFELECRQQIRILEPSAPQI